MDLDKTDAIALNEAIEKISDAESHSLYGIIATKEIKKLLLHIQNAIKT